MKVTLTEQSAVTVATNQQWVTSPNFLEFMDNHKYMISEMNTFIAQVGMVVQSF